VTSIGPSDICDKCAARLIAVIFATPTTTGQA
jgi:hypothetical protein